MNELNEYGSVSHHLICRYYNPHTEELGRCLLLWYNSWKKEGIGISLDSSRIELWKTSFGKPIPVVCRGQYITIDFSEGKPRYHSNRIRTTHIMEYKNKKVGKLRDVYGGVQSMSVLKVNYRTDNPHNHSWVFSKGDNPIYMDFLSLDEE